VQSGRTPPTFRGNVSPPFSAVKRKRSKKSTFLLIACSEYLWLWRRKLYLALKCWNSTGLHGVTSHKIYLLLIATVERTSDPESVKISDAKILCICLVIPCGLVELHQCFVRTYCLHLQDRKMGSSRFLRKVDVLPDYTASHPRRHLSHDSGSRATPSVISSLNGHSRLYPPRFAGPPGISRLPVTRMRHHAVLQVPDGSENGWRRFFRNVDTYLPNYTASPPVKHHTWSFAPKF
jgi:hypothetical protein